jgi:hypothetical protein
VPDLRNPQSLNRYSYVYNRPLVLRDPSGHIPVGDGNDPRRKPPPPFCPPLCPSGDSVEQQQESLQVDQTIIVPDAGGMVTAKGSGGVRQKLRDAGDKIGMAISGCKGIIGALLCSEAARRAIEEVAEEGKKIVTEIGPKTSAGLARVMGDWFKGAKNNSGLRPASATDAQLCEYLKVAQDKLDDYLTNMDRTRKGVQHGIQEQTWRIQLILDELTKRAKEGGG